MLKRSLALGALMAFVITGQAWAKNITAEEILPEYEGRVFGVDKNGKNYEDKSNTLTGTGSETITLLPEYVGSTYNYSLRAGDGGSTIVSNLAEIVIAGDHSGKDGDADKGRRGPFLAINGGELTLGTANEKIGTIRTEDDSKVGILFYATAGTLEVNADIINVKAKQTVYIHQYTPGDASLTINAKDITLNSDGYAVYNNNYLGYDSNLTINASNKLNISGEQGAILAVDGDVEIRGKDIQVKSDGVYGAIYGYGDSNVTVETIDNGKSEILGNIWTVDTNTNTSVALGNGGKLIGFVYNKGNTKLDLGTDSIWTVTDDSNVTTVSGNGNIKVGMTTDDNGEDKITKVAIKNAINTADGDNVTVSATAEVTDYIAGLSGEDRKSAMETVVNSVKANDTALTDTVTTDEGLIAGSYTLTKNDDGTVTSTQAANQTNTAIGESAVALKAHWRAHMNDMNKRMGELRFANGETGVWTRMVRGEAEYAGVKAQYNQYQLGYDEKLSVDKRWTVGAAVTFSEGDSNFYKGSSEDDSTAFAIYGSKLNNDGTFVDLIARYARLESGITTASDKSDYSTNGISVSAEFGKRIQQGKGLWIEPQVELTYGSVDSAEYVIDGKNIQVGDMDSLIGRVGFSIGKDIEKGNVYARASYLYDFDGETETSFSAGGLNDTIKEDLGGGWWEVGVGANINLSKATYIYADIEKTFGGEVDTNWQWNLGVRYSF